MPWHMDTTVLSPPNFHTQSTTRLWEAAPLEAGCFFYVDSHHVRLYYGSGTLLPGATFSRGLLRHVDLQSHEA
jgi:hypothetical protein